LEEPGPPGLEGDQGERLPGVPASSQFPQPLPMPHLVGQPLVGDDYQTPGADLLKEIIL
jgi:hypothetical protein